MNISENAYLSKRGYVIKKNILTTKELSHLKNELRGKPLQDEKYINNQDSSFSVYIETKTKIYIPKIYGIKKYGIPKTLMSNYLGEDWSNSYEFNGTLLEHQKEPIDVLLNELKNGSGGGILSLGTGFGKTVSCINILSQLKGKTIIIVNKISLLKQWESEIKQFLPNISVGILQGQKNIDIEGKDIIIAMLQSLATIEYSSELFDKFKITVVDECHNVASKIFSKVLTKLCSRYTIGLSATPKRSDGCEYIFKWFLGDIVYQSKSDRKGISPILNTIKINSDEYKEETMVNKLTGRLQIQFTTMLSELVKMQKRNKLIIELLKHYITTESRRILVLSDRRNHVKHLKELLDHDNDINFTYGLFVGQMKIKDLEASKSCQVILATYQAFGEGVNEKNLDTIILTTPKKFIGHLKSVTKGESGKLEQIIGRIFRKEHIEKNPLIIDLQDNFSVYKNQSRQRMVFYKEHFSSLLIRDQSIKLDEFDISEITYDCLQHKKTINQEVNTEDLTKKINNYCLLDDDDL